MTTTTDDVLSLGRALSFSVLAPLQLFYGFWTGRFPTPYLFIFLLLSGYTFAILSSYYAHATTVFSIYLAALFFILAHLVAKTVFSLQRKKA